MTVLVVCSCALSFSVGTPSVTVDLIKYPGVVRFPRCSGRIFSKEASLRPEAFVHAS